MNGCMSKQPCHHSCHHSLGDAELAKKAIMTRKAEKAAMPRNAAIMSLCWQLATHVVMAQK